jgi:hypothetical protein
MNLKRRRTMYIKNRRNSSKFNGFGSNQTLCLTESLVLRNRLLFIYSPLCVIREKSVQKK